MEGARNVRVRTSASKACRGRDAANQLERLSAGWPPVVWRSSLLGVVTSGPQQRDQAECAGVSPADNEGRDWSMEGVEASGGEALGCRPGSGRIMAMRGREFVWGRRRRGRHRGMTLGANFRVHSPARTLADRHRPRRRHDDRHSGATRGVSGNAISRCCWRRDSELANVTNTHLLASQHTHHHTR